MPPNFKLPLFLCMLLSCTGYSQIDQKPVTRAGGFVSYYHLSRYTGFFLSLERERIFKKNEAFTHGLRIDYENARPWPEKFFPGIESLIIGYEIKFYPFYFNTHKPYRGVFIGIDPCYFAKVKSYYRYGPGLGSLIGYQHWFKDKFSLGVEGSWIYMQNINDQTIKLNPQDRYNYLLVNIKIGIKL